MTRIPWNEQEPGHFEVDLVHHCGSSASGEYVHTLQMVDVATAWSERAALLGRSYPAMEGAFRLILARLPFPVLDIRLPKTVAGVTRSICWPLVSLAERETLHLVVKHSIRLQDIVVIPAYASSQVALSEHGVAFLRQQQSLATE